MQLFIGTLVSMQEVGGATAPTPTPTPDRLIGCERQRGSHSLGQKKKKGYWLCFLRNMNEEGGGDNKAEKKS